MAERNNELTKQRKAVSTFPKGGVSCSDDSFVIRQTLVFQINFSGITPALRVVAKHWSLNQKHSIP